MNIKEEDLKKMFLLYLGDQEGVGDASGQTWQKGMAILTTAAAWGEAPEPQKN
jgi:hypothetical protein